MPTVVNKPSTEREDVNDGGLDLGKSGVVNCYTDTVWVKRMGDTCGYHKEYWIVCPDDIIGL